MSLRSISVAETQNLLREGAQLIDIREVDEFARENIAGARNVPLSKLANSTLPTSGTVIFHCKAGSRTRTNSDALSNALGRDAFIFESGIDGWKAAGLAVATDQRRPIEMMRQVQIAAGAFALAGAVLGFAVSPAFYALSGAVGAGLMISGITGTCAMARVLKSMPWNKVAA